MNNKERVYWKQVIKPEKQEKFKKDLIKEYKKFDIGKEMFEYLKELTYTIKDKSGKVLEIYIPKEDL